MNKYFVQARDHEWYEVIGNMDVRWKLSDSMLIFTNEKGDTIAGFVNPIQFIKGDEAPIAAVVSITSEEIIQ